jgi:multidrug transporter EmrE-like cation transporter
LLSIALAVALSMLFKIMGRLKIPLAAAVPMNYLTCCLTGFGISAPQMPILELMQSAWLEAALLQGCFFYASFSLLALASQRIGLAVSALFSRIAMTAPVLVSFWLLGDDVTLMKISGILIALVAMALLLSRREPIRQLSRRLWLILALSLFCMHGIQLSIMNLSQHYYLSGGPMYNAYMAASFCAAFVLSALVACQRIYAGKLALRPKYGLAGIVLGLCNYSCVFFLISALGTPGWGAAECFLYSA